MFIYLFVYFKNLNWSLPFLCESATPPEKGAVVAI